MSNSLSIDLAKLLEDSEGYDVNIIVGEEPNVEEFKAHSLILSSRLTYFKSVLSSRWARVENGITIFNKPNISPSVFKVLLRYIYTGVISTENNEVSFVDIVIASDELQFIKVYQRFEYYLIENESNWKQKDIVTVLQHDHLTSLYNIAIKLACKNPEVIFKSEDFFRMKEAHLINLLKCDDLELDEIEIWEYVIQWGIENTTSILDDDLTKWTLENFTDLKNTLSNCIPHIRFFQMSPGDYAKVRDQFKDILPDGLDGEITQYFSNPNFKPSVNTLPLRKHSFDSIIINSKDAGIIASWIDRRKTPYYFTNIPFKLKLIYRASRDGFKIKKFHEKCDNKGPTLVVIKACDSRHIVGGYNPLNWCRVNVDDRNSLLSNDFDHRCKTSNSFIFSLTNRTIPILSRVSSKEEAIFWCRNKGP
ncbi:14360_t:CDS:2 [Acaulospora morrowiae]|uniref:14360_t:CDS:1 n=1 Tax=Acaulospora morrowiae TaxID=94023 RepID=A0A9N9BEZ2_9GLOM|nr:14360_t:CDS:2 [Acaulospora morrowiae]